MKINETIATRIATRRKANAWINSKATMRESVTLRQFSSANKLKTPDAIKLLKELYAELSSREQRNVFGIFLVDGKEPKWLADFITQNDSASLWFDWVYRVGPQADEREIFDEVIDQYYEGTASDLIRNSYRNAEEVILRLLTETGIDATPVFPTPFDVVEPPRIGVNGLRRNALVPSFIRNECPASTRYEFSYCMMSEANHRKFDFSKTAELEVRAYIMPGVKSGGKIVLPSDKDVSKYNEQLHAFVRGMEEAGYRVIGSGKSFSNNLNKARGSVSFMSNDDFRSGVKVTFPWDHAIVRTRK